MFFYNWRILLGFLSFVIVACCLVSKPCLTLCHPMDCSKPGFSVLHYLPELFQTHVYWVNNAIQPSHSSCPILLSSVFPSIKVFSKESALHIRWPKYWNFNFNISPCNEYSGLISFRIDWFDLFAVQGTLKSLLQYQSSKASILQSSAFFMVQLSHPHITTFLGVVGYLSRSQNSEAKSMNSMAK